VSEQEARNQLGDPCPQCGARAPLKADRGVALVTADAAFELEPHRAPCGRWCGARGCACEAPRTGGDHEEGPFAYAPYAPICAHGKLAVCRHHLDDCDALAFVAPVSCRPSSHAVDRDRLLGPVTVYVGTDRRELSRIVAGWGTAHDARRGVERRWAKMALRLSTPLVLDGLGEDEDWAFHWATARRLRRWSADVSIVAATTSPTMLSWFRCDEVIVVHNDVRVPLAEHPDCPRKGDGVGPTEFLHRHGVGWVASV